MRHRKLIACALAGSLALVACGGGDDDSTADTGEAETTPADSAAATDPFGTQAPDTSPAAGTDPFGTSSGTTGASGGCDSEPLEATEIGVSEDTITITVVADVDNPAAPGLFGKAAEAVQAFADTVNSNGGLGCRQLEVNFLDSKLNPDEASNAFITACQDSLALVGTHVVFFTNAAPITECEDLAGEATGLPDLAGFQAGEAHWKSPTTYAVVPPLLEVGADTESYQAQNGFVQYFEGEQGALSGVMPIGADSPSDRASSIPPIEAAKLAGVDVVAEPEITSTMQQAEFGPIIQTMKEQGANYAQKSAQLFTFSFWMGEAAAQGLDPASVTWLCPNGCYEPANLAQAGPAVDGLHVSTSYLPFADPAEAEASPALAEFVDAVGGAENTDGFGAFAWASAVLFRDVINAIVEADGPNGITRAAVLQQLADTHEFDADGMWNMTDIGNRTVSDCLVISQVQDGAYERVFPTEPGTFDCDPSYVATGMELDLLAG